MINGDLTYWNQYSVCYSGEKLWVIRDKFSICPPLFNSPKSCLPPGSDDGNTIEGMILHGWAWGVAGTTQNDYVYVESCDTIRYAKYYPDKAIKSSSNYAFYYCETR